MGELALEYPTLHFGCQRRYWIPLYQKLESYGLSDVQHCQWLQQLESLVCCLVLLPPALSGRGSVYFFE